MIMKKVLILLVMSLFSIGTFAQTQWQVDPYHSSLNFSIKHSGISLVNGKFLDYTGSLTTNGDALRDAQFNFNRSEEHTSELQSREKIVCRLLLEKNNE